MSLPGKPTNGGFARTISTRSANHRLPRWFRAQIVQHVPGYATYTTLLMSTGLTFGTIASLYGLQAGHIDRAQFSVLVTVVIATAIVPTVIAQRWFAPKLTAEEQEEVLAREEEAM